DATAVVFTPAVAEMARAVEAKDKLPYLLICAFVANAASFVLPISNPANLVIYGAALPPLVAWLGRYVLASAAAIGATFVLLRLTQRRALRAERLVQPAGVLLSPGGRRAGLGIVATAVLLMVASGFGVQLGMLTFLCGLATAAMVLLPARQSPWGMIKNISWEVLPLVAALFVMVAALDRAGLTQAVGGWLPAAGAWAVGLGLGGLSNLVNNLPAALLAGHALAQAHAGARLTGAALIGVDLGPNLSVTGSLATILWLTALRREGVCVSPGQFLRLGVVVMPPALVLALGGLLLVG
ncbi:MAG TPA: ArsB/NhaD family transporter, partial [Acidocella sp.]|nr:ArsB/NhaD family transporter [Acidocella sp.]